MSAGEAALTRAQHAFTETFVPAHRGGIRVIATDVDGTVTGPDGLLRAVGLEALRRLRGLSEPPALVFVTGRPAAAVQGLLVYTGFTNGVVIAENGGVVVARPGALPQVQAEFDPAQKSAVRRFLAREGIDAWPGPDNADRLVDLTFVPPRTGATPLAEIERLAGEIRDALERAPAGLGLPPLQVVHSTVHVHVAPATIDKGEALRRVLAGEAAGLDGTPLSEDALVVFGDSQNDAALFKAFPDRAVAVPHPGPSLDAELAALTRYAAPGAADEGFAAALAALFPSD